MIRSIRGRLQWWYGAVYALSLIVFGCLVYWRADRDMNERATLQVVSTAQYLDVSLRSPRRGPPRDGGPPREDEQMNPEGDRPGESLAADFHLGPLPPELQFGPMRDRPPGNGSPGNGPPENGPPENGPPGGRRRPDMGPPGERGQNPPRLRGPPGPVAEPPTTDFLTENSGQPRPLLDRIEYAVWRRDGSVLSWSDGFFEGAESKMPRLAEGSHLPQVTRSNGMISATMHGPDEATILVRRPLIHDMSQLHWFGFQIAGMAAGTWLVGIVGGYWISGRMVRPIQSISDTAASISATQLDGRIETDHLDHELVQLATVLNNTFERLETSFNRLTQFTADASHELRTPLAVIQSEMELALSQPRTVESYQQTLETCLRSSERMRSLIDGLLLLARTDSDHSELRPETVDLRSIAEDAVAQLQDKATSAGIDLNCEAPDLAVGVSADIRFLMQVPINLIDNAIQHTPSGGKIFVEVRNDDIDAVLSIRDNGCGIDAEHLPHLFERFYRVDAGRSRRHGGSGLGLSICKSLIDAHGGTILCESTVGEGSVFVVRLPLVSMEHP